MSYSSFVKDPILVAVASALIGLFLAFAYDKWKGFKERTSSLRILRHQLENQERQLGVLNSSLGKNQVCGGLDSFYIVNFLSSSSVDLAKDENLVLLLYKHLDNIELIRRALDRINMYAAGFTSVQSDNQVQLEENIKKIINECKDLVLECIVAIKSA